MSSICRIFVVLVLDAISFVFEWPAIVRLECGASSDSVLARLSSVNNPRIRFNLEKLQDLYVAEVLKATVGEKVDALNPVECDAGSLAGNIKEVLLSTTQGVLGRQRKKKQPYGPRMTS